MATAKEQNNFPQTEELLRLHDLEQLFRNSMSHINEEMKWIQVKEWRCREAGRSHGFAAAADEVADLIHKLDRSR